MRAITVGFLVASMATIAPGSAAADAGMYTVSTCQAASPSWVAEPVWRGAPGEIAATGVFNECAEGGWLGFDLRRGDNATLNGVTWRFTAPPSTSVAALELWRHAKWSGENAFSYRVLTGRGVALDESPPGTSPWEVVSDPWIGDPRCSWAIWTSSRSPLRSRADLRTGAGTTTRICPARSCASTRRRSCASTVPR